MARRITDLTMQIEEGMQSFPAPWHPQVEITQLGRHEIENRETRKLVLGTHTGTHIDAPRHFIPGGLTVPEIPLETLVGPATVVDLTGYGAGATVGAKDLIKAIGSNPTKRILLRFDWDRYLGTLKYYKESPFLSEEAAWWVVENGCILLGMDTSMPDDPKNSRGAEKDSPNHTILLGNGVILLEYMVNLSSLNQEKVEIVVAPIKIKCGDGAPARVFAIEEVNDDRSK